MFMRTKDSLVRSGLVVAMILGAMLAAAPVLARNGGVAQFPQAGVKMKNGLNLEIDSRGAESTGYRPVRVKLSNFPPTPSTYDRQVRITLTGHYGSGAYGRLAVSQVVEIPEGATSGEATIAIPSDVRGSYYMKLETREGGQRLEDLCADYVMLNNRGGFGNGDEAFPSFLFVHSKVPPREVRDRMVADDAAKVPETTATNDLPDVRNAVFAMGSNNNNGGQAYSQLTDRALLALLEISPNLNLLPPVELPERWIDLSTYSIIAISREDLLALAKEFPKRRRALQEWLAAGTVLIVYDAGQDYQHLAEIEKLLELPPLPGLAQKDIPFRGWMPASVEDRDRKAKTYNNPNAYNQYGQMVRSVSPTIEKMEPTTPAPQLAKSDDSPPTFVSRPAEMGWLIALPEKNPFPGDVGTWEWVLNSIPEQRESWCYRHGLTFSGHNTGFWNWHIAGVGAAPVFSFMLLASLFAVAIGPLNYLVLGRVQRLSMLLFTVPAGALIVTAALFLYAIGTDGLGVRTRVRSYTLLDQRSGQMVSWSRQTYFASVAPSRGLRFPADTLVFPLVLKPNKSSEFNYKAIDWDKDGQRLKSGFISSRSLQQFIVVRSAQSETKLEVIEQKSAPQLQVRNTLGTKIQMLVLRDSQGNYFAAENLPQDASAEPAAAKMEDAQVALTKLIKEQDLKFPDDYDPSNSGNALTRMFRGAFPNYGSYSPVSTEVSLLERNLHQVGSSTIELLEPGTYLALVDIAPDVPMGVPVSKQKESLHLIRGRW